MKTVINIYEAWHFIMTGVREYIRDYRNEFRRIKGLPPVPAKKTLSKENEIKHTAEKIDIKKLANDVVEEENRIKNQNITSFEAKMSARKDFYVEIADLRKECLMITKMLKNTDSVTKHISYASMAVSRSLEFSSKLENLTYGVFFKEDYKHLYHDMVYLTGLLSDYVEKDKQEELSKLPRLTFEEFFRNGGRMTNDGNYICKEKYVWVVADPNKRILNKTSLKRPYN